MSDLGRHGRNLSWLLIAEVIQKMLALALFAYATRKLSLMENGWYGAFLALFPLLVTIINAGFYDVAVRDVAQRPDRVHGLLSGSMILQFGLAIPVLGVVWLTTRLLRYPLDLQIILSMGTVAALLWTLIRMQYAVVAAHERFKYISLLNITLRSTVVLVSLGLLYAGFGALGLVGALIPISAFQIGLAYRVVRRFCGGYRLRLNGRVMRYLVQQGFPIAVGGIAATGYYGLDIPLLTSLGGPNEPSYYAIGMRFFLLCLTLADLLASVTYPILSRKAGESEGSQRFALTRCMKASALAALPLAVGGSVLSAGIVRTLCGERYLPSTGALAVLMWVLACEMVNNTLVMYLRAKSRQRIPAVIYMSGLAVKVLVSLLVIPRYGMYGFLTVNLSLSVLMTASLVAMTRRVLPALNIGELAWSVYLRPLAAAVMMGVALWFLRALPILVTIPLGAALYGSALMLLGGFDEFDRRMFKGTLRI